VLVLVGDLPPAATVDDVRAALGGWSPASPPSVPTPPTLLWHRPLLLDRADAVQTTIRIGGAAAGRGDPAWPALAVANTLFGGYFTSRVNQNLREVKGWTYGAQSRVAHHPLASDWMIGTDVGREFTAAALVEIAYELGRMVTQPVSQEEVDSARRYVQGTLAMGIQTQAGLAGQLASLAMVGMDVSYVQTFPAALEKVTVGDVVEAARRFLAPAGLTTVLVGDATVVEPAISPLMDIDRA
jgi:predicted Zn-dependent peptidase